MNIAWNRWLVIGLSFLVALYLSIYPLPMSWRWWRPEWVLLLSIYWMSVFPLTMSLFFLCTVGILQDVLEGAPLGEHPLSLLIVCYICALSYQRVRNFGIWKEAAWVFILVGIAQFPSNWAQTLLGRPSAGVYLLAPAFASAVAWPLLRGLMDSISHHYRIH